MPRFQGLGDTIKWLTSLVGIRTCVACEKRQRWLNKVFPFQWMTPQEKMIAARDRLWSGFSEDKVAALNLRHQDTIYEFGQIFPSYFQTLAEKKDIRFHILWIEKEVLRCALIPTPGKKVERSLMKSTRQEIVRLIKEYTDFRKVIWYV